MNKFEEMIEERKKNANLFTKIRIKIIEHKYSVIKDKALLNATSAAFESQIYDINKEWLDNRINKKKLETSKFFMYLIIINCSIIEIYSMWIMVHFADLSSLSTLMCAVIAESLSFAVYCAKAYFGKKGEVATELERENIEFEKEKFMMQNIQEDNITTAIDGHNNNALNDSIG